MIIDVRATRSGKVLIRWKASGVAIAQLEPEEAEAFEKKLRDIITEAAATRYVRRRRNANR